MYKSSCFGSCYALTTVEFEKDSQLEKLGRGVFNSSSIESISIPSSVRYIKNL